MKTEEKMDNAAVLFLFSLSSPSSPTPSTTRLLSLPVFEKREVSITVNRVSFVLLVWDKPEIVFVA